jgi:DNA-binding GntR family transcriptional regulator
MPKPLPVTPPVLVKTNLAELLREQIMKGSLFPVERIVESNWALRFGVGQASIREAINILAKDGFISKVSGRSARHPAGWRCR